MTFFVPNKIYKDRIAICKGCSHYLSLLGNCGICKCFMKVKARIAPMECPKKYWQKTTEVETPKDLPIYSTNYNTHTNCGSCISTCFDGIKKLYKKYK